MPQTVRDVMTRDPVGLSADATVVEAARTMREKDIGPVIVLDHGAKVCGIVTDRDITLRVVAEGKDPQQTKLRELASTDLMTVTPDTPVDQVVKLMRDKAIRRVPVCENDKPVGIVSIGDLAIERDPDSALADISEAPPNN